MNAFFEIHNTEHFETSKFDVNADNDLEWNHFMLILSKFSPFSKRFPMFPTLGKAFTTRRYTTLEIHQIKLKINKGN